MAATSRTMFVVRRYLSFTVLWRSSLTATTVKSASPKPPAPASNLPSSAAAALMAPGSSGPSSHSRRRWSQAASNTLLDRNWWNDDVTMATLSRRGDSSHPCPLCCATISSRTILSEKSAFSRVDVLSSSMYQPSTSFNFGSIWELDDCLSESSPCLAGSGRLSGSSVLPHAAMASASDLFPLLPPPGCPPEKSKARATPP
mmetsp:Transcript_14055/g.36239  ORF Transcript_14055/g.36239 Transcript_14055/m.36239 type:complete len:201 (-) Transcript_14055:289-891(-)